MHVPQRQRGTGAAPGAAEAPHEARGGAGAGTHIAASRDGPAERPAEFARIDAGMHARPVPRGAPLTDVSAGRTTLA